MHSIKTTYYNLCLDLLSKKQALEACENAFNGDACISLFFVNAHCFNVAQNNVPYHQTLQKANLVLNDGIGIKLGGILNHTPVQANLNGTDLIPSIVRIAALKSKTVFLLGGKPGVAELAQESIEKKIARNIVSGVHDGYFSDVDALIDQINRSGAELLIVGMGVPLQELFIEQNKHRLTNVKLAVAGGAILDFMSGLIPRAPIWVRFLALEWLYRLILEPKRLWKRYVWGNFLFFFYIIRFKFQKKS